MLTLWSEVFWNWCTGQNVDLISHLCVLHPWAVFWSHCCCCCLKSVIPDHIQNLSCFHLTYPYCGGSSLVLYKYRDMPIVLSFLFFLQFHKCEEKLHLGFCILITSWNLLEGLQIRPWISAGALDLHLFQLRFLISQSLYSRLAGSAVCCFWHKIKKCSFYYSREGCCSVFIDWASVAFTSVLFVIYLCFFLACPTFLFPLFVILAFFFFFSFPQGNSICFIMLPGASLRSLCWSLPRAWMLLVFFRDWDRNGVYGVVCCYS